MMHVTRHTFASLCLSEGISVRAVAECLGDTEATVQKIYSDLMPDDTDRVRKAIGKFFIRPAADGTPRGVGRA
jgi:site-specific recombinase XerD